MALHPPATHQTVRLTSGRHRSPDDGVCVMELASMLAGEAFTDRPRAVCPVLAAFLRRYNDGIDSVRRRDLYGVASRVVGTGGDPSSSCERLIALRRTLAADAPGAWWVRLRLVFRDSDEVASACATRLLVTGAHDDAMTLIDDLAAIGEPRKPRSDDPSDDEAAHGQFSNGSRAGLAGP